MAIMIGVIDEKSIGFSKRGKCCCCGNTHTKELVLIGEQEKYIKLCDKCFDELKKSMNGGY